MAVAHTSAASSSATLVMGLALCTSTMSCRPYRARYSLSHSLSHSLSLSFSGSFLRSTVP
jgi:hypothetical protein